MANILPNSLSVLIEQFEKMPGVGKKLAQKLAFYLLDLDSQSLSVFQNSISDACSKIKYCSVCQSLSESDICSICADKSRDESIICVVEDSRYLVAFEKTNEFNGLYHVLHGVISPMDDVSPDDIKIKELLARVSNNIVKEVIVATNPNVEGEATAIYIARLLNPLGIKTTRIAYGVPVGADLEYADEVTLFRAIEGRQQIL